MINFFFLFVTANTKHRKFFAPCKGNQDSPGVWIPSRGFRISGTGFQIFVSGTWIPDSLSCIPPGFWNADSLTWGKIWVQSKFLEAVCILTLTSATPTFVNEQEYWLPTTKKINK